MSKEIYISSTPHETRLAIVEDDNLAEIYYERENEYTLAGSIYNGRVTRVLPGMQSSFVEIGLERDAFLYITDFMEEAGDSADFEATHGGGGEPRALRSETQRADQQRDQQRGETQRGDGQRRERSAPATIEASATPVLERTEQSRGDNADRGDRTGRGRNRRGRSARGLLPESNGKSEQGGSDSPAPSKDAFVATSAPGVIDAGEAGEGAPGADGSRRWRGRRGRRRGRSGSQAGSVSRDESVLAGSATPGSTLGEEAVFEDEMELVSDPYAAAESTDDLVEVEVSDRAEPAAFVETDPGLQELSSLRSGQGERGRRDGGRPDRNGRNDRKGRGERNDRGDHGLRTPRGFAPSLNLYGVNAPSSEADFGAPALEPVILPGESLSKYRQGGAVDAVGMNAVAPDAASSSVPAIILARPATVVDDAFVASSWDGGLVLPGETLSRRTQPSGRKQGLQDGRREGRQYLQARPERFSEGHHRSSPGAFRVPEEISAEAPAGEQAEAPKIVEDTEGFSVAPVAEEQPEVAQVAHLDQVPVEDVLHETHSPFTQEVPAPLDPIAAVPEPGAPEAEYEPEEASASYRVDPAAPSEFRQSASILEEIAVEEPESAVIHVDHSHPFNRLDEADAEMEADRTEAADDTDAPTDESRSSFSGQSTADEVLDDLDTTGVPPPPPLSFFQAEAASMESSDITTISSAGEMHSELSSDVQMPAVMDEPASQDPTSPMNHESAIVSHAPQHFSPGSGQLEEELIDDEDHEPTTMHASHDEEFDDLEEETLEGAADLGTMLREMSIDQITRPALIDSESGTGFDEDEEDDEFEREEAQYTGAPGGLPQPSGDFTDDDRPAEQSAADAEFFANTFREPESQTEPGSGESNGTDRRPRRDGRRDSRRDGRDRNRSRSTGGESERGRSGGGRSRSMQATNLPAISDLLKPGQEILVQIAKEPIAKKGARITSHIALPGRFLVFMPTVNHTGVSRKIESDGERRRLKEILLSEKGEAAGGFIVRTAAMGASEDELRSDLRFLLNLWADIKQRSESSKSPALIYHDLNLVERILRDQVTDNFSAIWVDTESEYERVLRFLQRFQPQLIRRVKLYTKETPLFEQFGITEEINKALRSKVWLKSGGSIVINQTEALVAIDINTGKFVGKTARLEDTIVKTNLDAIPEIVRQIRLRDLGGIIIIDFIDMDERKNRNKVMAALEEELKSDRAPSKVLQFNDFGLVAITRKRVKQSLERTLSTTCGVCQGTGMTKSPITVCNDIYIEMRKMHKHLDRGDVMLRVHPEVVKQLKSGTSKWLQEMEEMVGKTILVKSDPSLHPEQFDIH